MNHSDIPVVALLLSSIQNTFRWKLDYVLWQTEIGGQMIFTDNHSKAGTGIVPVIPNYTEMQAGAYGIQKYRYERTAVEAGIRLDRQETRAGGYDWTGNYYGGNRKFCNFTYRPGRALPTFKILGAYIQLRTDMESPACARAVQQRK